MCKSTNTNTLWLSRSSSSSLISMSWSLPSLNFWEEDFNGWISDAKLGLFYKLTNLWEGSLLLLLLCCYFSVLVKQYGDHDMVQSILSWLASEAVTAIRSIIGQSIWKKETQMAHPMLYKVVPNFQKARNGYMNPLWWNCPICG